MKNRKQTARRKAMEVASRHHRAYRAYWQSIQIEGWLRQVMKRTGGKTFFLEVHSVKDDCLGISIQPMLNTDKNCVYNGYVMRFNIEPKRAIDNLMKFLREKFNDKIE